MPIGLPSCRFGLLRGVVAGAIASFGCGPQAVDIPITSSPTTLPATQDPAALESPVGAVHVVSVAQPNTCLSTEPGVVLAAGVAVGTAPCTGSDVQGWHWRPAGNLSLGTTALCLAAAAVPAAAGGAPVLAPCLSDGTQRVTFAQGRVYLAQTAAGGDDVVLSAAATASGDRFVPGALAIANTDRTPPQQWRVGRATPGAAGDANVQLGGVPLSLSASPGLCLTGRGITAGVTACNGSASQAWVLNETGGVQLGAYCLDATTPGTIAQGTPGQFNTCRSQSPGQVWQVDAAGIVLQGLYLSPTTVPPPAAGYTPSALVTTPVAWRIGG